MKCQLCRETVEVVIYLRFYTREGIRVCEHCMESVQQNKHKPYSRVMEKLALTEAGYYINRKRLRQ